MSIFGDEKIPFNCIRTKISEFIKLILGLSKSIWERLHRASIFGDDVSLFHVVSQEDFPISGCNENSFEVSKNQLRTRSEKSSNFGDDLKRVSHLSRRASFVGMLKCFCREKNDFGNKATFSLRCLGEEWTRRAGCLLSTSTNNFSRVISNNLTLRYVTSYRYHMCLFSGKLQLLSFIALCTLFLYLLHFTQKVSFYWSIALSFGHWTYLDVFSAWKTMSILISWSIARYFHNRMLAYALLKNKLKAIDAMHGRQKRPFRNDRVHQGNWSERLDQYNVFIVINWCLVDYLWIIINLLAKSVWVFSFMLPWWSQDGRKNCKVKCR